jgi:glutamate-1-semialdehyde 2,1-aminomutase
LFCTPAPVRNLEDAQQSDTSAYARLFHSLLNRGYYVPPSQFEIGFISAAHTEKEVLAFALAVVGAMA